MPPTTRAARSRARPAWRRRPAGALGPAGRGRLLDLGCGPGTPALGPAHLFGEAVGAEPDAGMIAEARWAGAGQSGVTWVRARAEELPPGRGTAPGAGHLHGGHARPVLPSDGPATRWRRPFVGCCAPAARWYTYRT
ncbi:class I SAM-dependent methyltransferase [Kitasatospora sp. NPDC059577]|uniref:class I SAM-dependent methyltransferase n=1 Tax=Kitasatospora sp. NPDC059577 TaxID=3346873 RepID=UPI0036AF7B55